MAGSLGSPEQPQSTQRTQGGIAVTKMTEAANNDYRLKLANKFLAFGYFIYAAAIILFIIAWLASIAPRLSQIYAGSPSISLVPLVSLLVTAILFTTLNIAIGRRLLANNRTRLTWILVLVSLLEIPIGTGLAFLTLLWLFARRNR